MALKKNKTMLSDAFVSQIYIHLKFQQLQALTKFKYKLFQFLINAAVITPLQKNKKREKNHQKLRTV